MTLSRQKDYMKILSTAFSLMFNQQIKQNNPKLKYGLIKSVDRARILEKCSISIKQHIF